MNRAGLKMIEAESLDQVRDQCVYPMVYEEYREAFKSLTEDVFKGISGTLEFRMIGLKGRPLWLSTHVVPLRNEKGEIVLSLAVTIDITERKEMEEALQKSEERYRRITEAITDYIYTVRVENGRSVESKHSEACVAVTGFTSREFAEDPYLWIKMVREEDHDLVRKQVEDILSGKTPETIEHRIIRKDGSIRWVESAVVPHYDMNGVLISYDGIVKDITGRKQIEDKLMISEEKFRALAEQSIAGNCLIQDGKFVYVNPRLAEMLSFSQDEMIGLNVLDLVAETDRDLVRENMRKRMSGDISFIHYTFKALKKDGSEVPMEVHGSKMVYHGRPAIMATLLDITERKKVEGELLSSEKKFRDFLENIQLIAVTT